MVCVLVLLSHQAFGDETLSSLQKRAAAAIHRYAELKFEVIVSGKVPKKPRGVEVYCI